MPSVFPSSCPSTQPSSTPSGAPTTNPSQYPSQGPSCQPSGQPLSLPTASPSHQPAGTPSRQPFKRPTVQPSCAPSIQPSITPTGIPLTNPSLHPTAVPSHLMQPFRLLSSAPSHSIIASPTFQEVLKPSSQPSVSTSTLISFQTDLSIFGLSEASFSASSIAAKAVEAAAATPINGITPVVSFVSVKDISSISSPIVFRLLSSSPIGCEVHYKVAFTISAAATASFSPSAVYTQYTRMISGSVSCGNFTKSLREHGGSLFQNTTVPLSSLNFSAYSVKVSSFEKRSIAPSSRPSSSVNAEKLIATRNNPTTVSALIIGLVSGSIALIFGFCYAVYIVYFRSKSCYLIHGDLLFRQRKLSIVPVCSPPSPTVNKVSAAVDSLFQYSPGKPTFFDLERVRTPDSLRRRRTLLLPQSEEKTTGLSMDPVAVIHQNQQSRSVHYDEPISPSLKIPEILSEGKEQFLLNSLPSFKKRRSSRYYDRSSPSAAAPRSPTNGFSPNGQTRVIGSSKKKSAELQSELEDVESFKLSPIKKSSNKF